MQLLQDAVHLFSTDKERKKSGIPEEQTDTIGIETSYICHRVNGVCRELGFECMSELLFLT